MTEDNIFCYSESYNDDNSFQQKRNRAFNKEVGEKRYYEIEELIEDIMPEQGDLFLKDYWKSVTQEQWKQLFDIPEAKDFKKGFEYISGVKINDEPETIEWNGKKYNKLEFEKRLKELKPLDKLNHEK